MGSTWAPRRSATRGLQERIAGLGRGLRRLGRRRGRRRRGDRGGRARARATSTRSCARARGSPRGSDEACEDGHCRSCSAATTRSRSGRSGGWRAPTAPAGCSGSTPTATSTGRRRSPSGNVHGMPLAAALGAAGRGVRDRRLADAVGRARRARRRPLARRGRAGADRRARRSRLHDERDRPARDRARSMRRGARLPRRRAPSCT